MKSTHSRNDYLYCADHTAKLFQEQWVDIPVEPLEWKAPKNRLKPSSVEPPKLELKELPEHLEYAFLQENNQLPVVISSALSTAKKSRLLEVLKNHKGAIAWSITDIKGIDSSFCTHKILMEEEFKPSVQPQRRVNPNIKEVVKKEVIKLLDAGLIYPISDSLWDILKSLSPLKIRRKPHSPALTEPSHTNKFPSDSANAPTTFQRYMTAIFHELIEDSMEVFMDDFFVFGSSFDHCLEKMLKRCEKTNLVLNWEKCHFMVKEGIVSVNNAQVSGLESIKQKSRLTKAEIRDLFLEERLMAIFDKNNKLCDLRHYFWDEPFLFKQCADRIIRRCVAGDEAAQILRQCHNGPSGGHHGIATTARKVFEAGFYWPYIFRDALLSSDLTNKIACRKFLIKNEEEFFTVLGDGVASPAM
ncbi:reverse transcriptase domain-containing protein [Tanacetum coccineum]